MEAAHTGYQLGSDSAELERLDLQGRVLAPATRTILQMASVAVCAFPISVRARQTWPPRSPAPAPYLPIPC